MILVDTNIIIRLVMGEPEAEAAASARFFEMQGDNIRLTAPVAAEAVYVLTKTYGLSRADVRTVLVAVLDQLSDTVAEHRLLRETLTIFVAHKLDFVDVWLIGQARSAGDSIVTLDRALQKVAGPTATAP